MESTLTPDLTVILLPRKIITLANISILELVAMMKYLSVLKLNSFNPINPAMSYIRDGHLAKYLPINGSFFVKDGIRYQVNIKELKVIYPVKGIAIMGDLREINCPHQYEHSDLGDFETFEIYLLNLEKLLIKAAADH